MLIRKQGLQKPLLLLFSVRCPCGQQSRRVRPCLDPTAAVRSCWRERGPGTEAVHSFRPDAELQPQLPGVGAGVIQALLELWPVPCCDHSPGEPWDALCSAQTLYENSFLISNLRDSTSIDSTSCHSFRSCHWSPERSSLRAPLLPLTKKL